MSKFWIWVLAQNVQCTRWYCAVAFIAAFGDDSNTRLIYLHDWRACIDFLMIAISWIIIYLPNWQKEFILFLFGFLFVIWLRIVLRKSHTKATHKECRLKQLSSLFRQVFSLDVAFCVSLSSQCGICLRITK